VPSWDMPHTEEEVEHVGQWIARFALILTVVSVFLLGLALILGTRGLA
jgi:uncharacterized membrane protein YphA (DoxX/SURF4 family)